MSVTSVDTTRLVPGTPLVANAPGRTIMIAPAVLARGRYSWAWVVPACPYCGKQHDHYGGPLDGDPYRYIGQVFFARCDKTDRRRLAIKYPTAALRYMLASTQPKETPLERRLLYYLR